ncbi:MAG: murein biosynthesis integral membrane protein MurJ [Chloroflexi bacterium]|nr:murein biosynthesis integral membrane protein MurJ [Chloroflexota bacterium]
MDENRQPPEVAVAVTIEARGIAGAASIVAVGNLVSRVLGLARESISAALFGASGLVSAFGVANIIPKQIYELLIGGMLDSALVPVLSEYVALKRQRELGQLVGVILSLVAVVLTAIVLLLELLAPQLTWLVAGGFDDPQRVATQSLLRIMLPSVLFVSLAGVTTALLHAQKRFALPAAAAAVYNAGLIVAMLTLSGRLGIYSLGVGVLLAAALQLAVLLPGLRRIPLRLRLDLKHPALKRIARLYAPIVLGLGVSLVQVTIDRRLASGTGASSIAWMDKATTLVQSAHGLVAVAISTAVLPPLAQAIARADLEGYRRTLGTGLRLALLLIVPLTVGMFLLAEPLVALMFQRGEFAAIDTYWTMRALRLYLFGLAFATLDWPLNYASYARQDTLTPALVGILSVGVYLAVALSLVGPLGMLGLVLADSAKHLSHAATMLALTSRRVAGLGAERLGTTAAKVGLAAAAMGAAVWAVGEALGETASMASLPGQLAALAAPAAAGVAVYAALISRLRIDEVGLLLAAVRRRLGR